MDEREFFFRLSPDRVLEAVEAAGFQPTGHCFTLNALENRVYDVRLDDESQVVAKFYRPGRWSREAIEQEHAMLFALEAAEIPVCVPLRLADGDSLGRVEDIHYAIWPRTGGRSPDELQDDQVRVLGRLLARIHNVGETVDASARRRLDSSSVALEALEFLEAGDFLPLSCAGRYRRAVDEVMAIFDERVDEGAYHPIHGDCHAGNLLHGDRGWFFLDFDDMVVGPAVQDVWMLLPGRDAEAARQRSVLVDAYLEFRAFDQRSLRLIEPLRAFRFVFYAGWIARRWEDPAFPDAFPHFGTDVYWENETRDLEQQLEVIVQGEEAGVAPEAEERAREREAEGELTNKDFFWDL